MTSRMDKYHSTKDESINSNNSRFSKNEHLYEELYTNKIITEFTNSNFDNIVDLSKVNDNNIVNRREQYQKNRYLNQTDSIQQSNFYTNSNDLESEELDKKEKNYNINDVLENARKNRTEEDEIEKKRRLKSVEYSILSDLSQEKLKEYHDNKQKKLTKDEEENLEELIHTITSNSLRKKIDDELLTDLLPNEESEITVSKDSTHEIEENNYIEEKEEDNEIDNSFYTKSMDLSNKDFELEEDTSFLENKKMSPFSKILISLFVLLVIGIIIYVVYRFI